MAALSAACAAAWVASRIVGVSTGLATAAPDRIAPGAVSLSTSAVLAVAAWAHWCLLRNRKLERLGWCLAVGMTCGFFGDLALSQLLIQGLPSLVAGLLAFGAGHAAYLVGLKPYALNVPSQRRVFTIWGGWIALAVMLWYPFVYEAEVPLGPIVWLVLMYAVMLASIAGLSSALVFYDQRFIPTAIGGALFLVSDLWIGITLFNPELGAALHGVHGLDIVWLTYGPAQLAIVYTGVVLVLWPRAVGIGVPMLRERPRRRRAIALRGLAMPLRRLDMRGRNDRPRLARLRRLRSSSPSSAG